MNFYTDYEIEKLRLDARHYNLDASDRFFTDSLCSMKMKLNGCGPARWSDTKRKALTDALKRYEVCYAVHDDDYSAPHIVSRKQADKRLKRNMLKVWKKDFGFWRWFSRAGRIERLVIIPTIYNTVVLGGKEAWEACEV